MEPISGICSGTVHLAAAGSIKEADRVQPPREGSCPAKPVMDEYAPEEKREGQGNERLLLVMETICATGIRVSELRFFTVEAIRRGRAEVTNKGKTRTVFLPVKLQRTLLRYAGAKKIAAGPVFVTRTGRPLDRSNIWHEMKGLCREAGVAEGKVFPHNLRHLFARMYYGLEKDIVRLADILGHSSINTTRIYTMESGESHRRQLERLRLVE